MEVAKFNAYVYVGIHSTGLYRLFSLSGGEYIEAPWRYLLTLKEAESKARKLNWTLPSAPYFGTELNFNDLHVFPMENDSPRLAQVKKTCRPFYPYDQVDRTESRDTLSSGTYTRVVKESL